MLLGLQVQHELAERPLQPRQLALQGHEPRPRHPGGGLEVHHPQRLAEVDVVPGVGDGGGLAPAADLDVVLLVRARRHVVGGQVGQGLEDLLQLRAGLALGLETLGDIPLEPVHLAHQAFGFGLVLAALGLADLLGQVVAPRLGVLHGGLGRAQRRVQLQDLAHQLGRA